MTGDAVRVRDLDLTTMVDNTDKLLIVTAETEKLSTIVDIFGLLTASDIPDLSSIYLPLSSMPANLVNTITTTAGAHTAVTNNKGNVTLKIPTKTSHLTNDSGFLTTETDPIFSASAAAGITAADIDNWNSVLSSANVQIIYWNE